MGHCYFYLDMKQIHVAKKYGWQNITYSEVLNSVKIINFRVATKDNRHQGEAR